MEFLNLFLPVLLYILGIILLIVLIILGIRLIQILNRVDSVIDNVEKKINSFNGFFSIVNKATDGFMMIGDTVIQSILGIFSKIVNRNKNKKNKEESYE